LFGGGFVFLCFQGFGEFLIERRGFMDTQLGLLDSIEAANFLGLKPKTLNQWRWRGFGPAFVRCGRACRYEVAELQRFIAANRSTSTADTGGAVIINAAR
jgi:hypothetical protein